MDTVQCTSVVQYGADYLNYKISRLVLANLKGIQIQGFR